MTDFDTEPNRIASDDDAADGRRGGGGFLAWVIALALLAFAAGLIANPWFERNVRSRLPGVMQEADIGALSARVDTQAASITALETRLAALEARPVAAPRPPASTAEPGAPPALNDPLFERPQINTERIARIDGRLDGLDRAQAALGQRVDNLSAEVAGLNVKVDDSRGQTDESLAAAETSAAQARSVLLLAAARRAFERSEPLGPLESGLRRHFGPNADGIIDAVAAGLRQPVELEDLRRRFERIAPALVDAGNSQAAEGSFWQRLTADLGSVFEVRRSGTESEPEGAAAAIDMIERSLASGDVTEAVETLDTLPPPVRQLAAPWRNDAVRYVRAATALDRLETRVLAGMDADSLSAPRAPAPNEAGSAREPSNGAPATQL